MQLQTVIFYTEFSAAKIFQMIVYVTRRLLLLLHSFISPQNGSKNIIETGLN